MMFCVIKNGTARFYNGNELIRCFEEVAIAYLFRNNYSERIADITEGTIWNVRDWEFKNSVLKILV